MARKTVLDFQSMKRRSEKITYVVIYDFYNARYAEQAGMDMILVGDSVGMSIYGYEGTNPVTMAQMICHSEAVRRGAPNTFVIGDMPFMSYQKNAGVAVDNAGRFYKEARVDAVKLEGGRKVVNQVRAIVDSGMSVMGHIGLTPQSSGQLGGFKAQGRTAESAHELILDAKALEKAGAFAVLLEAVPPEVGKIITERCKIPILSIGAGMHCDGQLLLDVDLLGKVEIFKPKFVKRYAQIGPETLKAFQEYIREVRAGEFPKEEHCYKMVEGELEKLMNRLNKTTKRQ